MDTVIIDTILCDLKDPAIRPDPVAKADTVIPAPGLAYLIQAAAGGDAKTVLVAANDPRGRDLGRLGRFVGDGERNLDKLWGGMDTRGEKIALNILEELNH